MWNHEALKRETHRIKGEKKETKKTMMKTAEAVVGLK
jgi:hypothetical protein